MSYTSSHVTHTSSHATRSGIVIHMLRAFRNTHGCSGQRGDARSPRGEDRFPGGPRALLSWLQSGIKGLKKDQEVVNVLRNFSNSSQQPNKGSHSGALFLRS